MALPLAKVMPPMALTGRAPRAAWPAARRVETGRRTGMMASFFVAVRADMMECQSVGKFGGCDGAR